MPLDPRRPAPPEDERAWLRRHLEAWCAVDTTSGREDAGLDVVRATLAELGAEVQLQPVSPGRTNVLATWGPAPRALLTTHLDTVPPHVPPRWEGDVLFGRGTCDAKGQALAQLAAIRRARARGAAPAAWLGVVGEETDSAGAAAALAWPLLRARLAAAVVVVDGEPTRNALATGQRGVTLLRLAVDGVACHSGTPERGRSAAWPLVDWVAGLRAVPLARDPDLGEEVWNLGLLRAGEAPNVVPAAAEAQLHVRTVPGSTFAGAVRASAPPHARVETLLDEPPDRFPEVPGFPRAAVPFGSDAPALRALVASGDVVLVGPGTIEVAHTLDEHLALDELCAGVDLLERLLARFAA